MLKKVTLTNVNTGRKSLIVVDTSDDERALVGAGKAPNELAKVVSVIGLDESVHRLTAKRPNMEDRVAMFGGLARCLDRNIATIKSFQLQANRVKSPRYKGLVAEVAADIASGEKVSDALGRHGDVFGEDVLALVRAGEEAGRLPEVCSQIARAQRKSMRIIKKLKTGLIYPGIVLVLGVGVIITMSYTLVPAVSRLYGDFGANLPFATQVMMGISNALIHYPYLVALPFIGLYMFFKNWGKIYRNPTVQKMVAGLPTIGGIIRKSAAALSFRTLSMLLEAGVRIDTGLRITAESAPHLYYREFFARVRNHVAEGLGLHESFLMESHWLGDDGRNICGIMETSAETGNANDMLNEIAEDYEEELDIISNQIEKILEPITICILGALVGFLIYAIYSPIFSLGDVVLPNGSPAKSKNVGH
ncbi:MAG: type II secretion system F family protein [Verrucomicrobiales bacterium]